MDRQIGRQTHRPTIDNEWEMLASETWKRGKEYKEVDMEVEAGKDLW